MELARGQDAKVPKERWLLTIADLVDLLQLSESTIRRLWRSGKLPHPVPTGTKRSPRWNADEIKQWLASGDMNVDSS